MRKETFFSKILTGFVPVFMVVISFTAGIYADDVTMSDSLKDDVTAMITNAKKLPHQIFIIDSSESMNSFAYDDYVDTCKDSLANVDKALNLCDNAYKQCRNLESNASCETGLNCEDVDSKCAEIRTMKGKLAAQCALVMAKYPDVDMFHTAAYDSDEARKYVGPWDPTKFYDEDLCFYDWTLDTNADVVEGTKKFEEEKEKAQKLADEANAAEGTNIHTAAEFMDYSKLQHGAADAYNKKKYCAKHGKTGTACDKAFNDFIYNNGGFIAERSDWSCLTDGTNNFIQKNKDATVTMSWSQIKDIYGGVSGLWLNKKYATSLDALKIILANRHSFSYPPRKRGEDSCYKTNYLPTMAYKEAALCTESDIPTSSNPGREECKEAGDPLLCNEADIENYAAESSTCADSASSGQPKFLNKTACFVSFDPTLSNGVNQEIQKQRLESIRSAIGSMWQIEYMAEPTEDEDDPNSDGNAILLSKCTNFDITKDFSIKTSENYTQLETGPNGCDKCYKWQINADNTGSFVETECRVYDGHPQDQNAQRTLGTIDETISKQCCKSYNCTNPKCRDNDICCKDNAGAYPDASQGGNESLEGYKTCRKVGDNGEDYSCVLGFYSEYDQDSNHCCVAVTCAELGEPATYYDPILEKTCDRCESGNPIGSDVIQETTGVVTILPPQVDSEGHTMAYCGAGSTEDNCKNIPVTVAVSNSDLTTLFDEVESIKIEVYYDCADSDAEHPSKLFGTGTCYDQQDCESSVVSGELSGCSEEGYRMEAFVTVTREKCHFSQIDVKFDVIYKFGTEGYQIGTYNDRNVFDKESAVYKTYNLQTNESKVERVYEYECKASFYNREVITLDGGSCPTATDAPAYINEGREGEKVEYCEARTYEREVIARDQWLMPTKVACSWLCRAAVTYDDPWKCASFFYMMDDIERNGPQSCSEQQCKNAMGDNASLAECCKCVNASQGQYYHHQTPEKVDMVDPSTGAFTQYTCSVSGYQYATGSNGYTTTAGGYQAEIVNGHITESGSQGYYNLTPYLLEDGTAWSPYPDENGWYTQYSLISSINGKRYLGDSLTSVFATNVNTGRTNVCVNDILWGWQGEDCNSCGTGCCAIDLSQNSNNCDYPQFWMKLPHGNGGRLVMQAANLLTDDGAEEEFRNTIKGLRALGPSTLGETLYDSWRYLGGMHALHDPKYSKGIPYTSPYAAQDPECFTNEAVIISGGNPQFDDNSELKNYGIGCGNFDDVANKNYASIALNTPCVNADNDKQISQKGPYIESEWEKTSLMHVAKFVNRNTFWSEDENCRTYGLDQNGAGIPESCGGNDPVDNIDANIPLIDRVHAIAIGEWGLSALYQALSSNQAYLDGSFIKNVAEITSRDGEQGRYYGLTATESSTNSNCNSGSGGSFEDLTCLFSSFVNQNRSTDVVVGRPHWTSSLVQPYDVEEKYRGPEAFTAGTVPIDGTVSRFWFGNLKKYEIASESGGDCPIYDDSTAKCGEWKRQTFDELDCFGKQAGGDGGGDFVTEEGSEESLGQFRKLMVGGAAFQLKKMIESSTCGTVPCFKSTKRNIFYDLEGSMLNLKDTDGEQLLYKFKPYKPNLTADTLNRIFDYMAGYDGFEEFGERTNPRYVNKTTFQVSDPFDIDFNKSSSKKLTLRPLYLGAIVHSKPVAVYYGNSGTTRIYAGANDGMFHAFDESGKEIYAYMPGPAFKNITNFANTNSTISFNATVDGPITMLHIDQSHDGIINDGEKAFLIFGYRRGASGYTVIDISDPNAPEFVQHINTDAGLSFGKAMVFRKCSGTCSYANDLDYYLAVPGGYDTCHDPGALTTALQDNIPTCQQNELVGNRFRIYKFDKTQNKFTSYNEYGPGANSELGEFEKSWLTTSFTAVPFVINTNGKAAVDTEYVYFTDLSGTVFRVDVSSNSMADWTAKVVYAKRDGGSGTALKDIEWDQIGRSFVGMNFFPPLERYNPSRSSSSTTSSKWKIPIPVIAGNAANPRFKKAEVMNTFYDNKSSDYNYSDLYDTDFYINSDGESHTPKNSMIEDKRGWRIRFNTENGEKGITEPLIVYDIYSSSSGSSSDSVNTANSYSVAWNTYIPMNATKCKTFGTSSNYERFIPDGGQVFQNLSMTGGNGEWTLAADESGECVSQEANLSLATAVGIVATDEGYDLTFGAGAEIFRKQKLTVKKNSTYIIKWYELY